MVCFPASLETKGSEIERDFWTIAKWAGGIVGYVFASLALSVLGSYLIILALNKGELDDSPGTGLFGVFLAGQLLPVFLLLGYMLLVEIIYSRLMNGTAISWSRTLVRRSSES